MTEAILEASLAGDGETASRLLGTPVDAEWMEMQWLMRYRLDQIRANPGATPWLVRAMVRREDGAMVGQIGFHGPPDAPHLREIAPEAAELGYRVYTDYRRQGYAQEAAGAMMQWATEVHGVRRFVLSISPDNEPSQRMAAKMGFVKVTQLEDEIDGPEDVLVLDV